MVGNPIPIPTPMAILSEVVSPSADGDAGEGEPGVVVVAVGDGLDVVPVLAAGLVLVSAVEVRTALVIVKSGSTKVSPGAYDGVLATTVFYLFF